MAGGYSKVKTVITGETITASDRNAEHDNHISNADPSGQGSNIATTLPRMSFEFNSLTFDPTRKKNKLR